MGGRIVRVLERSDIDWTGGTSSVTTGIAIGGAPTISDVDVSTAREITALIRMHSLIAGNSGASLSFRAYVTAPTNEDPGLTFRETNPIGNTIAYINTIANTTTTPQLVRLVIANGNANIGGWITIAGTATQGAATGNLRGIISIDLSLKD